MNKRICCVLNYAPHYRKAIFQKMDQELHCDFYFGNNVFFDLRKMDCSTLKGFKRELKTLKFGCFIWYKGIMKIFFTKYDAYIIGGNPFILSHWVILLFCLITHKKLLMWGHGLKRELRRKHKFFYKLFYGNKIVDFLLYGNYARNLMIKEGFKRDRLHVIYNSLDYETQNNIRKELVITDIYEKYFHNNYPVIIFIGRLQREKRLELIIESQKYLSNINVFFNVIFIGTGEMERLLKDISIKSELRKRIWFYGSCYSEQQIAPLIYNATLSLSPGAVGLTAIHSMTYGTPVITHSNFVNQGPEFETIKPGVTGDFYEEGNLNDLNQKVSSWINKSKNDRETIRSACYKIVDTFYNPEFQIQLLKSILK